MEQKVLDFIYKYDEACNENYGVTALEIAVGLEIEVEDITATLNNLFTAKRIIVRKAAFGPLIFLNYGLYTKKDV